MFIWGGRGFGVSMHGIGTERGQVSRHDASSASEHNKSVNREGTTTGERRGEREDEVDDILHVRSNKERL